MPLDRKTTGFVRELLTKLIRRLKPQDGMRVNAKVWQAAHNYHLYHQQAHALLAHGPGIVSGLEVHANKPPDRRLWIQPGMAIDPLGRPIVLSETTSYEIKADEVGLIRLYFKHKGESEPDEDHIIEDRFAFSIVPDETTIELARFRLKKSRSDIKEAEDPALPGYSEIDMRFRQTVRLIPQKVVGIGIKYLGQPTEASLPPYGAKAGQLAYALSYLANMRVCIDELDSLEVDLSPYPLLYLIEQGPQTELNSSELEILKAHLQRGGTLFVESYQPLTGQRSAFAEIFKEIDISITPIDAHHPLLLEPFFFSIPPQGDASDGQVYGDGGVIFSTSDYGRLWQREKSSNGEPFSREQLRIALEWGSNIITYVANRMTNSP